MASYLVGGRLALPLNIYLLKPEVKSFESALANPQDKALRSQTFKPALDTEGRVFVKEVESDPPAWVGFVQQFCTLQFYQNPGDSVYGLILVHVRSRFFAFTFGQGRHLLDMDKVVEDFGLKYVLNRLDPLRIRTVGSRTMSEDPLTVLRQLATAGDFAQFGVNVARDILQQLEAKPADLAFATTISGRNSLRLNKSLKAKQIEEFCNELLAGYQDVRYKEYFAWVDYVRPVDDSRVIGLLEEWLLSELRAKRHRAAKLVTPIIIEPERVVGYRFEFRRGDTTPPEPEPNFEDYFIDKSNPLQISLGDMKRDILEAVDESLGRVEHWTVYQSLYVEHVHDGRLYILNQGRWLAVEPSFNNDLVANLRKYVRDARLPPAPLNARPKHEEEDYNKQAAKSLGAACLDRKLVRPPGEVTPIELCDIYSNGGAGKPELIHVKIYRGSATLSHLFAQGRVSGTQLRREQTMVQELKALLRKDSTGLHGSVKTPFNPQQYIVRFGIIVDQGFRIPEDLPIFAKTDLSGTIQALTDLGYDVCLQAIERR